jgi:hypothetical protein
MREDCLVVVVGNVAKVEDVVVAAFVLVVGLMVDATSPARRRQWRRKSTMIVLVVEGMAWQDSVVVGGVCVYYN